MTNSISNTQIIRDITTFKFILTGADKKVFCDPQPILTEKQVGRSIAL